MAGLRGRTLLPVRHAGTPVKQIASLVRQWTPTFLLQLFDRIRSSFWLIPSLAILLALPAATLLIAFDRSFELGSLPLFSWATTTPEASFALLGTMVGAQISVTGVTFSVMMLLLSQTSSQLGPRVVRTVVTGNEMQIALGVFMASTAFSMTVLQSIREAEKVAFVPELAVLVSIVGFGAASGTLIFFVNHVSNIIRVPVLLDRLAGELRESIDANLPVGAIDAKTVPVPAAEVVSTVLPAPDEGYLQGIDCRRLLKTAEVVHGVVRVTRQIGTFVYAGAEVAVVQGRRGLSEQQREDALRAFVVGVNRTPRQDVEATLLEIAEIGVRALSPGINDPRTARMCIDRLGAALGEMATRPTEQSQTLDDAGDVRVVRPVRSFSDLLTSAFTELVRYSAGNPLVQESLLDSLSSVMRRCVRESDRVVVRGFLGDMLVQFRRDVGEDPRRAAFLSDVAAAADR